MFANIQQLIFQMHFHEKRIETLLNDNQPFYPNFTIAGGAIRDLFLGREINGPDHPMAQIKYKPDDSYDGLRQGTFQCWRPDKKEPDA